MTDDDPRAILHRRLRTESAQLMGLDLNKLSAIESVQCDLIGVLLLEIDSLQSASISGRLIDMGRLADAVRILKSLMPDAPLAADGDFEARHAQRCAEEFAGAREKFSNLMAAQHERHEASLRSDNPAVRAAALRTLSPAVNEIIAEKDAEIARLRDLLPPAETASPPTPIPPPPERTPPPPNVVPMRNVPEHYLAQPREAWRDFVRPDGSIGGPGDRWSNKA
jgi:hypothetical protein